MDDLLDDIFMNFTLWQQSQEIANLKSHAQAARVRLDLDSRDTKDRVEALEREVGELALLTRALLEVLQENGGVGREELFAAMARIDAQDGVVDGRVTPEHARPKPKTDTSRTVTRRPKKKK
jgi:HAMP domain-containing protein